MDLLTFFFCYANRCTFYGNPHNHLDGIWMKHAESYHYGLITHKAIMFYLNYFIWSCGPFVHYFYRETYATIIFNGYGSSLQNLLSVPPEWFFMQRCASHLVTPANATGLLLIRLTPCTVIDGFVPNFMWTLYIASTSEHRQSVVPLLLCIELYIWLCVFVFVYHSYDASEANSIAYQGIW